MQDNLYTGEEARKRLFEGIKKVAGAVKITLGTAGANSVIQVLENPKHYVTNDGFSIANAIRLSDPLEEMGREILLESINRANRSSGDGSSTTACLTEAILEEGMKYIDKYSPMDIKNSLESMIPVIETSINAQKKEITIDTVSQVASISAEEEEIGNRIQEIYQKIGSSGIIHWDISKTPEDSYTLGNGLTINGATYVAPYMCEEGTQEVRMKNPKILLARKKITTALDFETLFPLLYQQEIKEVVIFCDEIDVPVIADLYKTQRIRGFRTVVIKMPILWGDEWWEDLAEVTGGKVIDAISGIKMNEVRVEHLGTVEYLTVTREDTFLEGIQDIRKHTLALQVNGDEKSLLRASRLNTQTARYFVGGHSDSSIAYRRLKVEDAINASVCALQNGVVAGGGIALFNASEALPVKEIGGIILIEALKKPFQQILFNAGIESNTFRGLDSCTNNFGYDSRTKKLVNMFEAGIIDPCDVVLNAVRSAIGVAASILTCGTVVTLPKEEASPMMPPMMR